MKKIVIMLLAFMLVGCANKNISVDNLSDKLDSVINNIDIKHDFRINNSSTYFSYYIPSDCQEMESSENASIIYFLNSKIVMNLNIASIVNNKFYKDNVFDDEGFFDSNNLVYVKDGVFTKNKGITSKYYIKVYEEKGTYLIQLKTNELNFYASTSLNEIEDVIKHIFLIARSVEVNNNQVIASYSQKDVIDYEKKQIDLFDYVNPSDGYLSDLINSSNGTITSSKEPTNEKGEVEQGTNEEIQENKEDSE